jgi:hypothetical protein
MRFKEFLNESGFEVVYIDHNYKSHRKVFKNNPNGAPDNASIAAKKFKNKLDADHAKNSNGLYRSIEINPLK